MGLSQEKLQDPESGHEVISFSRGGDAFGKESTATQPVNQARSGIFTDATLLLPLLKVTRSLVLASLRFGLLILLKKHPLTIDKT